MLGPLRGPCGPGPPPLGRASLRRGRPSRAPLRRLATGDFLGDEKGIGGLDALVVALELTTLLEAIGLVEGQSLVVRRLHVEVHLRAAERRREAAAGGGGGAILLVLAPWCRDLNVFLGDEPTPAHTHLCDVTKLPCACLDLFHDARQQLPGNPSSPVSSQHPNRHDVKLRARQMHKVLGCKVPRFHNPPPPSCQRRATRNSNASEMPSVILQKRKRTFFGPLPVGSIRQQIAPTTKPFEYAYY